MLVLPAPRRQGNDENTEFQSIALDELDEEVARLETRIAYMVGPACGRRIRVGRLTDGVRAPRVHALPRSSSATSLRS
eukprot:scaffold2755_cov333-Prasinococcus_capsulatus_cf.AAC.3